jgi:hypothetical protein
MLGLSSGRGHRLVADVRTVPRGERNTTSVRQIVTGLDRLVTVAPGEDAAVALDRLAENDLR